MIHLGSNDIGLMTANKLFSDIECDLLRLHTLYPDIKFIWSEILMRCYWHTVLDGNLAEKSRKRANLRVRNLVLSIGGYVIRHCNIRARERKLYRHDGTHLSKLGNEIYLNNIQGAIERFWKSICFSSYISLNFMKLDRG